MLLPRDRILALDIAKIAAYLAAHGWKQDPELSSPEAAIYQLAADPQAEIILPLDRNLVDYALRLGEVLQTLALAERRTAWELLEQFSVRQAGAPSNGAVAGKRKTAKSTVAGRGKQGAP
jgi:hypothetical protein